MQEIQNQTKPYIEIGRINGVGGMMKKHAYIMLTSFGKYTKSISNIEK